MYICENGHEFTQPNKLTVLRQYKNEDIYKCPVCGTDDVKYANKCPICGNYHTSERKICPTCLAKHSGLADVFGYIIIKYSDKDKQSFIYDIIDDSKDEFDEFIIETEAVKNE